MKKQNIIAHKFDLRLNQMKSVQHLPNSLMIYRRKLYKNILPCNPSALPQAHISIRSIPSDAQLLHQVQELTRNFNEWKKWQIKAKLDYLKVKPLSNIVIKLNTSHERLHRIQWTKFRNHMKYKLFFRHEFTALKKHRGRELCFGKESLDSLIRDDTGMHLLQSIFPKHLMFFIVYHPSALLFPNHELLRLQTFLLLRHYYQQNVHTFYESECD